jgi:hypothetical protein
VVIRITIAAMAAAALIGIAEWQHSHPILWGIGIGLVIAVIWGNWREERDHLRRVYRGDFVPRA